MSKDTCIKANTYCPVHKGIVGADCWHDSKDFSVPRTDWKQVDEINTLREQVEKLTEAIQLSEDGSLMDQFLKAEREVEKLTKERDAAWSVNPTVSENLFREQLAALAEQNEKMREACEFAAERFDHPDNADRMLVALPDLASPVLNRIRAEGVRKASTLVSLVRNDWASAGDNLSVQAAEYLISALDARAAELENEDAN